MVLQSAVSKSLLYQISAEELALALRKANITYDLLFKELYFRNNAMSKWCREDLMETMIDQYHVEKSELLNEGFLNSDTSIHQRYIDGGCRVNGKDIIICEMQRKKPLDNFDRFVSYGSGVLEYRGIQNESYDYGKNIVMVFACFPLPEGLLEDTLTVVHRTNQGVTISELITLLIIPLFGLEHLFEKAVDELTKKERYCLWLAHHHEEKYQDKIHEIVQKEEGLQMAEAALRTMRDDKKVFNAIMSRHIEICDRMEREHAEKAIKEAQQKANEAVHLAEVVRKKSEYFFQLLDEGKTVDEAKKLAEEKYTI